MKKGFTMLELLAVLAILAILSTGGFVFVRSSIENANRAASTRLVEQVASAEKRFYATQDRNSIEYISEGIIDGSSELVSRGYLDWSITNEDAAKILEYSSSNDELIYKIESVKFPDIYVLQSSKEFRRDLFLSHPDMVDDGDEDDIDLTDPDPDPAPDPDVISDNVFVYGTLLFFNGDSVFGDGATVFIQGDLLSSQLRGNSQIGVSNIYIDGNIDFSGGSAGMGSQEEPGDIIANDNVSFWDGTRSIYGDIYVNGKFSLKDARIYGDVFVNGDLEIGWTPYIAPGKTIYYTGNLEAPNNFNQDILNQTEKVDTVPIKNIPAINMPSLRDSSWYEDNNYTFSNNSPMLSSGERIFGTSYNRNINRNLSNIIIVASQGDIVINAGGRTITGIFYAPNGKVEFSGSQLEGLVISRDGFYVTSGGTDVIFRAATEFVTEEQLPFTP